MSFFQSSWNFGPGVEDFTDLENNIDVGDLLRMDTGEELHKSKMSEIKIDKYQQQLDSVMISLRPEDLINSSLPNFSELIKDLTKESQDICREIRKKGRNKIHALKCRKKSRDEVSRLQEQVEMEKEKRRQLLEDNRRFQQNRDEMYQLYLNKKQEQEWQGFTFF